MQKIPSKKRKQIIADYIECENANAVARKHHVSPTTVKNIICADADGFGAKCAEKKQDVETDILKHMEGQRDKVCMIIDKYLDALLDDRKIETATPNQLTTAMGTLIDKFLLVREEREDSAGVIEIPAVISVEAQDG